MKKFYLLNRIIIYLLTIASLFSCSDRKEEIFRENVVVDDLGYGFKFEKPPERIITLAPNLTEFIFDMGLEDRLIGNTLYCDYPEKAADIEKVGDLLTFNFEKILMLKPDLIFITVEGNTRETYDKFRELGLKIFVSNPRGFEGIKKTCVDIGKIFGKEEEARLKVEKWDSIINGIKNEAGKFENPALYFAIELKPLMVAGKNTFMNEIIEICGAKNLASGSAQNYPVLNREEILKADPDYLLFTAHISDTADRIINLYPEWKTLNAVKNSRLILIDRNLFGRPGPRFAEAASTLFNLLHPQKNDPLLHSR